MGLIGLFAWILISSAWPMAAHRFAVAQASQSKVAEIRINHDIAVENQRLEFIFLDLLRGTGLHGGFVATATCSDLTEGRLQIRQGSTLQEAMDELVAENPSYEWQLKDGTVNLIPQFDLGEKHHLGFFSASSHNSDVWLPGPAGLKIAYQRSLLDRIISLFRKS